MTSPGKKKQSPIKCVGTPKKKKASPNKKGNRVNFDWDKRSTMVLLELCAEYQADHGKKQHFKWPQIVQRFEERTGRSASVGILRNRMEIMKKHYHLWERLKQADTGLGVDPHTGKIDAGDDWWDKKIKENPDYRRFREKGVSPDMDELWTRIFGDSYATGEHCVAPVHMPNAATTIDVELQSTSANHDTPMDENEPEFEMFEHTDPMPFRNLNINDDQEGGSSSAIPIRRSSSPSPAGPKRRLNTTSSAPLPSPTANTSGGSKRPKLSRAACAFQDAVTELRAEGRLAYDLIGSICGSPSVDKDKLLKDAYGVLYGMVNNGLLQRDTELFNYAASRILDESGLKGFMFLDSDDDRLSWLKYQMSKNK